jgi:hypothetical protein
MANTRKRKASTKEKPVLQKITKKKATKKTIVPKSIVEIPTTIEVTTSGKSLSSLVHEPSWSKNLQDLFNSDNFKRIEQYLNDQWSAGKTTYPPKNLIFEAFNKTPFDKVKVVLLGQDPYHDDGQVEIKNILE